MLGFCSEVVFVLSCYCCELGMYSSHVVQTPCSMNHDYSLWENHVGVVYEMCNLLRKCVIVVMCMFNNCEKPWS